MALFPCCNKREVGSHRTCSWGHR